MGSVQRESKKTLSYYYYICSLYSKFQKQWRLVLLVLYTKNGKGREKKLIIYQPERCHEGRD